MRRMQLLMYWWRSVTHEKWRLNFRDESLWKLTQVDER